MSVQNEMERRKVVRETYLSFYKDSHTPNRICSLTDIQNHKVPLEECQIAYIFVVGGNPDGPTELVKPNTSFPMTVDEPTNDEDDVVFLNIQENLEDGKSQSWVKYASMVVEVFPFDYIAKVDSDTLLFTPAFLRFATEKLPKAPNNKRIYGGLPNGKDACDINVNDTHACPLPLVGDVYMKGDVYWMSPDVAAFVASDALDRSSLMIRHEDVDVGNFVFSYPETVKAVLVNGKQTLFAPTVGGDWEQRDRKNTFDGVLWGHSTDGLWPGPFFKSPYNFRKAWRQFQAYWLSGKKLEVCESLRERNQRKLF
jgi:hypothetical protein